MKQPWREKAKELDPPSLEEFNRARKVVAGRTNPELMDLPFWTYMVRTQGDPFFLRQHYGVDTIAKPAVWSYARMGMPSVVLDDRFVLTIGGEHEDFYDPDFRIYNDVVIRDFNGGVWIYGYPISDFPPTDFHTATYVDDEYGEAVYIIGGLGYQGDRVPGTTPVYKLTLEDMVIRALETNGELPGWIFKHEALLINATAPRPQSLDSEKLLLAAGVPLQASPAIRIWGGERCISKNQIAPKTETYELDLRSLTWSRIE